MFKIFVINLKRDTQRREYIENHLDSRKLKYEIIDGVYGKDLSKSEINEIADLKLSYKKMGKTISVNEIGCALSHQKAYKKIINENLDGALILEDDIILSSDIKEIIESIYEHQKLFSECFWVGMFRSYINTKKKLFEINAFHSIYKSPRTRGAVAYYIDKSGAEKLLNLNKKITYVSDWFFGGYLNKINLYAIDKSCAMQNPNIKSTIGETRKKELNILKSIHIYLRKTYKRMFYYKYQLGILTGCYKKTKLCDELIEIKNNNKK